ncbi:MAG: hypothetical protein ACFB51_19325, partial [Anaerolineae bacterium]
MVDRTIKFSYTESPPSAARVYLPPELPPYFVQRSELITIKKQLIQRSNGMLAPIVLHGPPGTG